MHTQFNQILFKNHFNCSHNYFPVILKMQFKCILQMLLWCEVYTAVLFAQTAKEFAIILARILLEEVGDREVGGGTTVLCNIFVMET